VEDNNVELTVEMALFKTMELIANKVAENKEETDKQFEQLESRIESLEVTVKSMRNSAIRGEIASGQKTKDVATRYGISSARVSKIAPRRKYNNG